MITTMPRPTDARLVAAMQRYDTLTLRGVDYRVLLLVDGHPLLAAGGLPVEYRSRNEAGIDILHRAEADALAALPDDGSGDDIGDPDEPGDSYPRTAVRYVAA